MLMMWRQVKRGRGEGGGGGGHPGRRLRVQACALACALACAPAWSLGGGVGGAVGGPQADAPGAVGPAVAAPPVRQPGPGLWLTGEQGPLVVLQAGLGDDHRSWDRLVADLALDHRVLTLDRPGQGTLPAGVAPRDPCRQADELQQRLQAAGLAPPYLLVGHSLGGRYAWAQARRHPQTTRGLLLLDATPPDHWSRLQAQAPALALLLKALRSTVFDATSRAEFDDQDGCMAGLVADSAAATVPTRVLASGRRRPEETGDVAALLVQGQALWPALTGAPAVHTVPDAGHYLQRDATATVAAAVRQLSQPTAPR